MSGGPRATRREDVHAAPVAPHPLPHQTSRCTDAWRFLIDNSCSFIYIFLLHSQSHLLREDPSVRASARTSNHHRLLRPLVRFQIDSAIFHVAEWIAAIKMFFFCWHSITFALRKQHKTVSAYRHESIQQAWVRFRRSLQPLHWPLLNDWRHLRVFCVQYAKPSHVDSAVTIRLHVEGKKVLNA